MSDEYNLLDKQDLQKCVATLRGAPEAAYQAVHSHPIEAPRYAGLEHVENRLRDAANLYRYRHGAHMLEALLKEIAAEAHKAERA